jgi:hypothetical protein
MYCKLFNQALYLIFMTLANDLHLAGFHPEVLGVFSALSYSRQALLLGPAYPEAADLRVHRPMAPSTYS